MEIGKMNVIERKKTNRMELDAKEDEWNRNVAKRVNLAG